MFQSLRRPPRTQVPNQDLSRIGVVLFGKLNDQVVLQERAIRRAKWGVRLGNNAFRFEVLKQLELGIVDVQLKLIDHGLESRSRENLSECILGEVANADLLSFP